MSEVGVDYGMGGCTSLSGWQTAGNRRSRKAASEGHGAEASGGSGDKIFGRHIRSLSMSEGAKADKADADRTDADRTDADRTDADRTDAVRTDADRTDAVRTDADRTDADRANTGKTGTDWDCNSTQDMTLEEYTQFIYSKISELSRRNYSRGNSVFIYISQEGFRAMYEDPEYEAWVMENIRSAYSFCHSRSGHDGYHSAHFFGATKEEYRGQSWRFGCSKCEQERRRDLKLRRKKQLKALLKKRQEREWQEKQRLEKQRLDKIHLGKQQLAKESRRKMLVKRWEECRTKREVFREEALVRREAESARRMYEAMLRYSEW